jgi:hypothetical protein
MKSLIISMVTVAALVSSASAADTFTFSTVSKNGQTVSAMGPGGQPVVGGVSTFENQWTDSAGKKSVVKGTCAVWTTEPGAALALTGVCNSTAPDGNSNVMFSCSRMDPKTRASNCWGFLVGTSGKYQGRTGSASWQTKQDADGKGSSGAGAGVWNN